MSGGSLDYFYSRLNDMVGGMHDPELDELIKDLVEIFHDLEWWQSADISEEDYRETVDNFKNKWLRGQPTKRLKSTIDRVLEEKKQELYKMIGVKEL